MNWQEQKKRKKRADDARKNHQEIVDAYHQQLDALKQLRLRLKAENASSLQRQAILTAINLLTAEIQQKEDTINWLRNDAWKIQGSSI